MRNKPTGTLVRFSVSSFFSSWAPFPGIPVPVKPAPLALLCMCRTASPPAAQCVGGSGACPGSTAVVRRRARLLVVVPPGWTIPARVVLVAIAQIAWRGTRCCKQKSGGRPMWMSLARTKRVSDLSQNGYGCTGPLARNMNLFLSAVGLPPLRPHALLWGGSRLLAGVAATPQTLREGSGHPRPPAPRTSK